MDKTSNRFHFHKHQHFVLDTFMVNQCHIKKKTLSLNEMNYALTIERRGKHS